MSHRATNWAFEQRGLKPATKLVLLCLADRHNPDYGCFPAQDTLANDAEMSRSALNEHLKTLENAGLIRREQRKAGKTKRQDSTRYLLGFEIEQKPQDVVEPCPESGHGNGADSVSGNGEKPCPDSAESRVRIPDTNPVREPVSKPVTERESAQARGDADGEGTLDVDAERGDDPKQFAKRVKRLEMGSGNDPWPGALGSSTKWAIDQFAKLTDAERLRAEARRDAYLAECRRTRTKAVALGVYLRDRKFDDVSEAVATEPRRPDGYAAAFGPAWSAWRIAALLAGPNNPDAPEMQRHRRFSQVSSFQGGPSNAVGRELGPRWHRLQDAMEPVPVDSELYTLWQAAHDAHGWPWLPDHPGMRAIWFPKGGPEGLAAFEAKLREAGKDSGSSEGKAA